MSNETDRELAERVLNTPITQISVDECQDQREELARRLLARVEAQEVTEDADEAYRVWWKSEVTREYYPEPWEAWIAACKWKDSVTQRTVAAAVAAEREACAKLCDMPQGAAGTYFASRIRARSNGAGGGSNEV